MLRILVLASTAGVTSAEKSIYRTNSQLNIQVLKNTKYETIVKLDDILITYHTNGKVATLNVINTISKKHEEFIFISTKRQSGFTLKILNKGQLINTVYTSQNLISPGITLMEVMKYNDLREANSISNIIEPLRISDPQYYKWDGVQFVKGFGIKYPHPDYEYYHINPWDTEAIGGQRLVHIHLNQEISGDIVGVPPAVAGAIIGGVLGGIWGGQWGAIAGSAIGAALGVIMGNAVSSRILDENNCIWLWISQQDVIHMPTPNTFWYLRIGPYTVYNMIGMPNP